MHDLLGQLHVLGLSLADSPVTPRQLNSILDLIDTDKISGLTGKDVLRTMINECDPSRLADVIVAEHGLEQVSDVEKLRQVCREVTEANPQQVQRVKQGHDNTKQWLVGQVMRATQGKANPIMVHQILSEMLSKKDRG